MTAARHAVVAGSLGHGNLGDEAILTAFLTEHMHDYASIDVLTTGDLTPADTTARTIPPPHLAMGLRFWRGARNRRSVVRDIVARAGKRPVDYVWLGGLFGNVSEHLRVRRAELEWAQRFAHRLVYYFGDVGEGFNETAGALDLIAKINECKPWISVRSAEAAQLFRQSALDAQVRVGVDPALAHRVNPGAVPFPRRAPATPVIAIVPCNYEPDRFRPLWIAAAHHAARREMSVRWISVCDPTDLELCRELQRECGGELCGGPKAEAALWDAACTFATRYHGLIFSLAAGVPTVTAPYGAKVRRLADLAGLGRFILDPDDTPRRVGDAIDSALSSEGTSEARLEQALTDHANALDAFRKSLRQ